MSFFNKPHHDFHWLAGMLSGAGLLVIAAVFISGGGIGRASPVPGVAPASQAAGAYLPCVFGYGCGGGTHFAQSPINFYECDSSVATCPSGSGNHILKGHTGVLRWTTGFYTGPGQVGQCWLSGGQFGAAPGGSVDSGWDQAHGQREITAPISPNDQPLTYTLYCYETYETGWSDNQANVTLSYCAPGQSINAQGKCDPPADQPTAAITADSQDIQMGQSVGIHATFTAGQYDALANTNIDSPEGTGLGADTTPGPKDITFTPTAPGTYTFYARVKTSNYDWQSKATVSVVVDPAPSLSGPQNLQASCNAAGTSVNASWGTAPGANYYWTGLDDTGNNAASCQSGWDCASPPDYSQNVNGTSQSFAIQPNSAERLLVSSCISGAPSPGSAGGNGHSRGSTNTTGTGGDTCSGASEVDFTCHAPVTGLSISANNQTGLATVPANTPVTVAWSSSNIQAGSCRVSNNANGTVWSGDSGSQNIGSITSSRIYSLNCTKADGTPAVPATVTLSLVPGSIDGSLTATPARVQVGNQTHLSWHTVGMASCALTSVPAAVPATISSAPASSDTPATVASATTFTLSCNDGTSNFTQSVSVGVVPKIIEQ